jgi:hypothetical protein
MNISQFIKPASKYWSNGRYHFENESIWYETDFYNVNFNGVNVKAKKVGKSTDTMIELYYSIGGDFSSSKYGLTREEVELKIIERESIILNGISDFITPSEDNILVGHKIWERELKDSLEDALCTLLTCGRYNPKEKRFFAKSLIDKKIITTRHLINFTHSLMI